MVPDHTRSAHPTTSGRMWMYLWLERAAFSQVQCGWLLRCSDKTSRACRPYPHREVHVEVGNELERVINSRVKTPRTWRKLGFTSELTCSLTHLPCGDVFAK